jgi:hypothetical protein
MKMRLATLFAATSVLLSAGCATGPGAPPEGLVDGVHSFTFVDKAPFLLDRHYLDVSSTYTGQWAGNRPQGRGEAVSSYGLRCTGEFGIEPTPGYFANPAYPDMYFTGSKAKDALAEQYYVWGRGEVYANDKLLFRGVFRNKFYFGESCLPAGDGVWFTPNGQISGNFWTDISSREESGRVFVNHFMSTGACKILRKDGSTYVGDCRAPVNNRVKAGSIYLNEVDLRDPFIIAAPWGTFTGRNGDKLPNTTSPRQK